MDTHICVFGECVDVVPDSRLRSAMKLAGLGEKRFPLEVHCISQEVYDELCPSVFRYISGTPMCDIIADISEVPDSDVKQGLENVCVIYVHALILLNNCKTQETTPVYFLSKY